MTEPLGHAPDRDGMAWLSAYLPGDQAVAIWNRTTAIARGLQGPAENRTLTQLRADAFATALLSSGTPGHGTGGQGTGGLGAGGLGADPGGSINPEGHGPGYDPGQVPPLRAEVLVTVPVFLQP